MSDYDPSTGRRRSRRVVDRRNSSPRPVLIRLMLTNIFRLAVAPFLTPLSALRLVMAFHRIYPSFEPLILPWMHAVANVLYRDGIRFLTQNTRVTVENRIQYVLASLVHRLWLYRVPRNVLRAFRFQRQVRCLEINYDPNLNAYPQTGRTARLVPLGVMISFDEYGRSMGEAHTEGMLWPSRRRVRNVMYIVEYVPTSQDIAIPDDAIVGYLRYPWCTLDNPPFPLN
jgi:hypothetical protein